MKDVTSEFGPGVVGVSTGTTARFNQFFDCLDVLQVPKGTVYARTQDPSVARNRNDLIKAMMSMGPLPISSTDMMRPEWIFFLDDDHEFDSDVLMRKLGLWRELDVEAIGSLYVKKVPPYEPVVYKNFSYERFTWKEIAAEMVSGAKTLDVAACGGSGLFVSRAALETMLGGTPIKDGIWFPEDTTAEDIGFCAKLKNAHDHLKTCDIVVDLALPLGHTTPTTVTPEWDGSEWLIRINYGPKGFRLPAKMFHP